MSKEDAIPAWKRKLYAVKNEELPEAAAAQPASQSSQSSAAEEEDAYASSSRHQRKAAKQPKHQEDQEQDASKAVKHDKRSQASHKPSSSKDAARDQAKESKRVQAEQDKASRRGALPKAAGRATGQQLTSASPAILRNHRKALAAFQDPDFSPQDFMASSFQDATDKGVENASVDLVHLRDHCLQQVQSVVLEHHKVFLQCSQGRGPLDEALTELRTLVQDMDDLYNHLSQLQHPSAADGTSPGGSAAPESGSSRPGTSRASRAKPISEAIEAQVHDVLSQLEVAVAERDFSTAVGLLGLMTDIATIINRDAGVLAAEVGDVANWRRRWEVAVDAQKQTLMSDLEGYLSRGSCGMSVMELRGAAAALAALAGHAHAAQVLLACHASRITTTQAKLLKHYTAEGGASECHLHQLAGSLLQHAFLGISAAADDVVAVWGRHTTPTAALLSRWAEVQVRQAAHAMKHHALMPYADTSALQDTMTCIQIGLVLCGALELTHFLSLTRPFLAELWQYVEAVVARTLRQLSEDVKAAAQQEVADVAITSTGSVTTTGGNVTSGVTALQRLACVDSLLHQLSHICKVTVPLAGPKLSACLAPALPGVLTALFEGVVAGYHQVASLPGAQQLSRSLISHLSHLCDQEGPLTQALRPLTPGCGPLLDLTLLAQALTTTKTSMTAARTAAAAGQLAVQPTAITNQPISAFAAAGGGGGGGSGGSGGGAVVVVGGGMVPVTTRAVGRGGGQGKILVVTQEEPSKVQQASRVTAAAAAVGATQQQQQDQAGRDVEGVRRQKTRRSQVLDDDSDGGSDRQGYRGPSVAAGAHQASTPLPSTSSSSLVQESAQHGSRRRGEEAAVVAGSVSKASKVPGPSDQHSPSRLRRPGAAAAAAGHAAGSHESGDDRWGEAGSRGVEHQGVQPGSGSGDDKQRTPSGGGGGGGTAGAGGHARRARLAARAAASSSDSDSSRDGGRAQPVRRGAHLQSPAAHSVSSQGGHKPGGGSRPIDRLGVLHRGREHDDDEEEEEDALAGMEEVVIQSRVKLIVGSPIVSPVKSAGDRAGVAGAAASPVVPSKPAGGSDLAPRATRSAHTGSSVVPGVALAAPRQDDKGVRVAEAGRLTAGGDVVSAGSGAAGGTQGRGGKATYVPPASGDGGGGESRVARALIASKRAALASSSSSDGSDDDGGIEAKAHSGASGGLRRPGNASRLAAPVAAVSTLGSAGHGGKVGGTTQQRTAGREVVGQQEVDEGPKIAVRAATGQDRIGSLISSGGDALDESKVSKAGTGQGAHVDSGAAGARIVNDAKSDPKVSRTRAQLRARAIQASDSDDDLR